MPEFMKKGFFTVCFTDRGMGDALKQERFIQHTKAKCKSSEVEKDSGND